ncbi:MAG: bifunctional oligoribonuclease/PAP phosphatase NrnA [Caldimicrobium sp.]
MDTEKVLSLIKESKEIVLVTHQNPDIDGLSSMLAFSLVFSEKNPLPLVEELPANSQFLHGIEKVKIVSEKEEFYQPDLLVVFDAQCEKRIPEKIKKLLKPKKVLIFDHHQEESCDSFLSCTPFKIINSEAPSTTYIIYKFLKSAYLKISPEVSENLLSGLYYDTGSFKYENVKGDIFLVAQELMDLGARPNFIARELFENIPFEQIEMTKLVLERLELLKNGEIALSYLKKEDFEKLGGEAYLNDPASLLRSIKGVKVSALVKEVEEGLIKVSLRSKAPFEILELAKKFGGGGHKYACGFKIKGESLYNFLEKLKRELEAFL